MIFHLKLEIYYVGTHTKWMDFCAEELLQGKAVQ